MAVSSSKTRIISWCFLQNGENCLYVAVDGGHTGTVGVLLDYMQSVDNRVSSSNSR
jgi:hypothetical protein